MFAVVDFEEELPMKECNELKIVREERSQRPN
jgi:hypothetical protein